MFDAECLKRRLEPMPEMKREQRHRNNIEDAVTGLREGRRDEPVHRRILVVMKPRRVPERPHVQGNEDIQDAAGQEHRSRKERAVLLRFGELIFDRARLPVKNPQHGRRYNMDDEDGKENHLDDPDEKNIGEDLCVLIECGAAVVAKQKKVAAKMDNKIPAETKSCQPHDQFFADG